MSEEVIKGENVEKKYGDLEVLSDLNFQISEDEIYGLLGPNGSGKTTLINLMTGQEKPTSGTITLDGKNVSDNPVETKSRIGVLPEKETPFTFLTPREHFHFCAKVRGLEKEEAQKSIEKWAKKLSFEGQLDTLSNNLSRGNQQKVMFTQAVIHNPDVLFIDEPVANLDPIIQEKLKDILIDYNEKGNTIVISTHHLEFALDVCSSGLLLSEVGAKEISFEGKDKSEVIDMFNISNDED
jgi:ABC-2 type transport system ATP-binding protein